MMPQHNKSKQVQVSISTCILEDTELPGDSGGSMGGLFLLAASPDESWL